MFTSLAIAALIGVALPKATPERGFNAIHYGEMSCGDWHQGRGAAADAENALKAQWVVAFIFGRGALRNENLLGGVDGYGVSAWLANYCSTHPLDGIETSAFALERELLARSAEK